MLVFRLGLEFKPKPVLQPTFVSKMEKADLNTATLCVPPLPLGNWLTHLYGTMVPPTLCGSRST